MKKLAFIGLIVVFLASSYTAIAVKSNHIKAKTEATKIKKVGPDCKVMYDRKCNFGSPSIFPSPAITNSIDVYNFCRQTSISCSVEECTARLNVLYGFQAGSPKNDSCLPAGFRGK